MTARLSDVAARLRGPALDRAVEQAAGQTAEVGLARMRMRLSGRVLQRRGGALFRTARVDVEPSGSALRIVFRAGSNKVPYAAIHEHGGIILPKRGRYLKFRVNGEWRQVTRVVMPERPYVRPSLKEAGQAFPALLSARVTDALSVT